MAWTKSTKNKKQHAKSIRSFSRIAKNVHLLSFVEGLKPRLKTFGLKLKSKTKL